MSISTIADGMAGPYIGIADDTPSHSGMGVPGTRNDHLGPRAFRTAPRHHAQRTPTNARLYACPHTCLHACLYTPAVTTREPPGSIRASSTGAPWLSVNVGVALERVSQSLTVWSYEPVLDHSVPYSLDWHDSLDSLTEWSLRACPGPLRVA